MLKHLQKMLLFMALLVPWATQAQVTCDSGDPDTVTNLPAGTTASSTTSYFPGYSLYNYSYSEVIIPSSQLEDGGINEIKGLMFKPASTSAGTYFNNCTIYLANTDVANLSSGFISDVSEYVQVFAGSLNYSSTDWQTVVFDDSFIWDGSSNIVVAVKRDHGTYTSGSSFTAFSAGSSLGRYIYQDSGPYTPGSVSGGTATSTVAWYKLLGCSGDPVACNRVRNLAASNILSEELTLSWIDTVNSGATYSIYALAGDTNLVVSNLSTDSYTISGLNPNTVYTFAVVANCGADGESAYSKITVRTACAPIADLPFTYGFDDAATGTSAAFPSCWARINDASGSTNYYPYVYASAAHSGTNGLYWYMSTTSTYASNEYVILPPVDVATYQVSDLTLAFWAGATSATYHPVFVVGVMSDPADTTTFVAVDTVSNIPNEWIPYAVNLANYSGTGSYVAIKAFRPTSSWYAYMDDILLTESSNYCAPVSDLADSAGINDVTLTWTGDESGSYLIIFDTIEETVVTGTTYTIEDLDANTTYEYAVAQLCTDTSYFVYGMTHTLAGEPISVFPYTCGFEIDEETETNEAAAWVLENGTQTNYWMVGSATNHGGTSSLYITNDGSSNAYTVSTASYSFAYAVFNFEAGEYSYSYDWQANGESSYDFIRAAVVPATTNVVAGQYNGFDNSSAVPAGGVAIDGAYRLNLVSSWQTQTGTFTITEPGLYKMVFMWRNDASGGTQPPAAIDNIYVNANTCPAPTAFHLDTIEAFQATLDWTAVGDETQWLVRAISATGAEDWQSVTSHPYIYTGLNSATDYTFELMAYCGEDDSSLVVSCAGTTPVTCPAPTDVVVTVDETTATAAFTWTDESGSSWEFVYGDMGFSPYSADNSDQVTTTAYQVSNLDTGFYDAYVRTLCGGDDQSAWVGPINFSYGVTVMNMATSGSDTVYTCAGVIYDDGGATGSYSANCQSTLVIYPGTPGSDVIITGVSYTESTYDYLRIYSGVGTSGELLFDDYGVSATQSFGPFSSDAITVVFHSDGSVFYDGFQINVACGAPSSCPKPTHFAVNPVQADNVVLNWGNPAGASSFELVVGAPGIVPDTVESPITTTDTFYVFNDLQPGVSYNAFVRAICSDENSNWAGPISFVPGQYIIGTSGSASVSMCGGVIYDDGGPNGQYSNNADYLLTVYPSSADSMLTFQGSAYTEGSIDYLKIYEGVGTNGNLLWQTSTSSQQDVIPLTTVMSGPITLHFHTDGSVVYSGFELFVNCVAAPECAAVENLSVTSGPTSAVATWDEGFFGTYTGAMVEYREIDDSNWTALAPVTTTYVQITGLTPNTTYNLRVTSDCDGFDGDFVTANFTTGRFPCLEVDSSTIVNVVDTIGQGATTSTYFPSYSFYNYGLTQQIFTPNEIGHSGTINALAFKMSAVSQQRTYEIYMGHTPDATASQFINPADLTCVYNGGAVNMVANQWTNFTLTTPFYYNGSDNLVVFFRDMTGSYVSGNAGYGFDGASGASRYVYQDSGPYTIGSTTGGTSSSFRNVLVLSTTDYGCLLSDSCAAPVAAVSDVTTTSVDVVWAPGYAETNWNVYYRQAGETAWSAPVSVTTTSYSFTNLNSGMPYEFKVEGQCNNNTLSTVVEATTLCAAITTLPYTEDFNNWGTGTLPNCWYNTGAYSTTSYSIISGSQNLTGATGGSVYMYSSSGATYVSRIIMPALDTNVYHANQTQVVFNVKYTSTSYGAPKFNIGVMDDANDLSTWTTVATVQHSGELNVWEIFEVPLDSYTGNGAYIGIQTEYPGTYFYCYLDNVTLETIPTCPRPDSLMATNATSTTVDLSWHERGNATNWIIEYGPRGFVPGTGTTVTASSNPFTLTGLSAGYQGEYYVKADCGAGDVGEYSRIPCPFGTAQIPATLPYTYDFENAAEWDNWQTSSNTTIDWYRGNAVANNSNYSMYISADQGATYIPYNNNSIVNAAVYRDVDFGSVQSSFVISFDARVGGTLSASYDGLMVFLVDPSMPTVASTSSITSPWGNVNDLYRIATVRIDTVWQNYQASFDTISGIKRVAFFWFNQNTGASYPALLEAAAIDNIHIEEATCPRPLGLTVDNVGGSTANLSWDAPAQGASYEVIYRPYPEGTQNSFAYSNTNSIVLTGLQSMTQYAAWVRKICGTDTSLTSIGILFTTDMCDNGVTVTNFDTTMTATTSSYSPIGYSFYKYSYTQTIIDSAQLAELTGDITAFAFSANNTTAGSYFTNMTVYMANIPDSISDLSSSFIHPSADIEFVKVIDSADFSYGEVGMHFHAFDTAFTWDGHSNILFSVSREHGAYSSGATFDAHTQTSDKMRYVYTDGSPYDYMTVSGGYTASAVGDIYLISCGGGCARPTALPATDVTYNGATLNWSGNVTDYEVAVKAATDATWPAEVAVSNATSYVVTSLMPETMYQFRVRAICDAAEGLISDWVEGTFTTAELPCFDPENLVATGTGYTTATLVWDADESQNMWSVKVWNNNFDQEYTASGAATYTVTGLAANTSYYAAVKALCGNGIVESGYSDTVQFTTNACGRVTGVTTSGVTAHSVVVSWNDSGVSKYKLEYGDRNFSEGNGTTIIVENATSYTITNLDEDHNYSVFVKAICEEGVEGDWSEQADFTTPEQGEGINEVSAANQLSIYPNPANDVTTIAVSGVNGEVSITIVDMNGRVVASDSMSCEGDCTKSVEVSGLAQGAYFVRVNGENLSIVRKLIVK